MSDDERRARLAVRHRLVPSARADDVEDVVRSVVVLHSTEPATVHLSCWARSDALTAADVDRALYVDRNVVKQLAMRRTLFVFPLDLLPATWPSASARVAGTERARLAKDVVASGVAADGTAWLDRAADAVLAHLAAAPEGRTAAEVREAVPEVDVKVADLWVAPRVLTYLGVSARIVRGTNTGGWHTSRPRWTRTADWLADVPEPWTAADGYRELVRRWLRAFGPGTEADLVWWLGSTKAVVRTALAELQAEAVALDGGGTGWLLPDDLDEVPDPGPWAALLPVLDPTAMGWKERDAFLGPHRDQIFDRNGNAGTTAWVDGRIVGCWVQDDAATVELRLLEPVTAAQRDLLDVEAARLTTWLDGRRIGTVYRSPAMR